MSVWKAKRFWKEAVPTAADGGYSVLLDGRPVRTPAKAPLVVPTLALAEAIAEEWQAQEGEIDPRNMPLTRSANSAIDKVRPQFDEVAAMLASYGETDLVCYRATGPAPLVARQADAWDPLLKWMHGQGVALHQARGIVHVPQPAESIALLRKRVFVLSEFELAALHDLVAISGSLVIGLAAMEGWAEGEALWSLSRVDEDYQEELWGRDEEAAEAAELKRQDFLQALRFLALLRA